MRSILCMASLILICPVLGCTPDTPSIQALTWNEKVILSSTDSRLISSGTIPRPLATEMAWPDTAAIEKYSVNPGEPTKIECEKWIRRFMRGNLVPADIKEHLVAMKRWDGIAKGQQFDAFIVRYRFENRVFHIVETPLYLQLAVFPPDSPQEAGDHAKLLGDTAAAVLNGALVMRPDSPDFHVTKRGTLAPGGTEAQWFVESVILGNKSPRDRALSEKSYKTGALSVEAMTDGRVVTFFIMKYGGATMPDPNAKRF